MNKIREADIVIVGGGIAGVTFALALAKLKLKILIVDKQPLSALTRETQRVVAITPENEQFYSQHGVWQALDAEFVAPFNKMEVWDQAGSGAIHFSSRSLCIPHLGSIVYNHALLKALQIKLADSEQVEFIQDDIISINNKDEQRVQLEFKALGCVQAKLLVGADGAQSHVRRAMNIDMNKTSYAQRAIVATLETEKPHERVARQAFSKQGPLAFLPLAAANQVSVVWSQETEQANKLLELNESEFETAIAAALDNKLGPVRLLSKRFSFMLQKQHAKQYYARRTVLIGDAIHTIHPLAGQGLNLGIADACALAALIQKQVERERDFGKEVVLQKYQRMRKGPNQKMIHLMDMFHLVFTKHYSPLVFCRNIGLNFVNHLDMVKCEIMRFALGISR